MNSEFRIAFRLLLSAALVAVFGLATVVATREAKVNRITYNRILVGMDEAEVDRLMDLPPIDLAPLNLQDVAYDESRENLLTNYPPPHTIKSWEGKRYLISVCLDRNGRVAAKYYKRAPDASLPDRVADWLGI